MATAFATSFSDLPTVQYFWHWFSCGQTRPHTAGSRLFVLIRSIAPWKSRRAIRPTKSRMGSSTGQPVVHGWFLHWRQRCASRTACASV